MMTFLIRLFYLPFFLIVGNGLAIYLVSQQSSKIWLIGLVMAFIAIAFLTEKYIPYNNKFNHPIGDQQRDVLHAVVNESMSIVGIASLSFFASIFTVIDVWPHQFPLWGQVLLAVLIADIGITLMHYASHRNSILWRLHAVHHSVKRMYGLNGLMKHPLHQGIEILAGTAPLLLIGTPPEVFMLLLVAVIIQLLLQHSNVDYFVGPLRNILAINSVHRFHHLKTAKEGDVNFGLFTTFTDYVLGTAYFDSTKKFSSTDLGISTEPDYPIDYLNQVIEPFRPKKK